MNLGQIFEETIKAMINNDTARLEELSQMQTKRFAEIRSKSIDKSIQK